MAFRLSVEDGRFARTLEVRTPDLTVGTARGCDLRLESDGVGRRHARLRQCGRKVVVEDLGARQGVLLAGRRVHRAALAAGDSVRLGGAHVMVLEVDAPATSTADDGSRRIAPPVPPGAAHRARAATPLVVSIAVHAAALVLLWGSVLLAGAVRPEEARLDIGVPVDVPDLIEDASVDPEPELELPERLPDPTEILPPEEYELPERPLLMDDPRFTKPEKEETEPEEKEPDAPEAVGLGSLPETTLAKSFGKGEASGVNRAAAGILDGDAATAGLLAAVRGRASKESVWVLQGDYDQAEQVLAELAIGHAVVTRDTIETSEVPDHVRLLVYNCTGRSFSPDTQRRIAEWVSRGGWLVTTDWGVERLLEKAMPDTLSPLRVRQRPILTKDETVGIRPTRGKGLGAGLPMDAGISRWWLEDSSVPFTIAKGLDAEILVRSEDLERRLGKEAAGVAVTFPFGRGRVLHLLGHVYQQEGNLRGAVIMQRLVINFAAASLREGS